MPTIEIDDEVLNFIEQHATGFQATPNRVLRQLMGMDGEKNTTTEGGMWRGPQPFGPPSPGRRGPSFRGFGPPRPPRFRSRKRRASLDQLVTAGILKEGQKLVLKDFQGNPVEGAEAVVKEGHVWFGDQPSSMSKLAGELLRGCGYKSPAFRGPRHWFTEDGRSIDSLWQGYQSATSEAESSGDKAEGQP